jgi:aminoglycoside 6'-N-acetyltransferase
MPDTGFTRLLTPRLVIRRFRPADAPCLSAYRSDPEVARFQGWGCPYPEAEAERFIAGLGSSHPGTPGEWFQFAVALRETDLLVGDCALLPDARDPAIAEFGCTFDRRSQGRGYATEALDALSAYAKSGLSVSRLVAVLDTDNLSAARLVRRLGFGLRATPERDPPSGPLSERELFYERKA